MKERQYIGARYVVKTYENSQNPNSAEWEANTSYEPLTLVTYQNSSYLSKKQVPATVGNPAANAAYWIVTGYYNGQIVVLDGKITALEDFVDELSEDVERLEEMAGRKYILISDSYGNGVPLGESYGWLSRVKNILGLTEGVNVWSYGLNGAGFVAEGITFLSALLQAINDITDKDSITDIYVGGGINDVGRTGVENAIHTFCDTAKANFKNARIKIGFMGAYNNRNRPTGLEKSAVQFWQTKYSYCNADGRAEVDAELYNCLLYYYDNLSLSDGLHPTEAGYAMLGIKTAQSILGKSNAMFGPYNTFTFTPATGLTLQGSPTLRWMRSQREIRFTFMSFMLNGTPSESTNTNLECLLGTISTPVISPLQPSILQNGVEVGVRLIADGKQYIANGQVIILDNGQVRLRAPIFDANGNRVMWSAVTGIEFVDMSFAFAIDTLVI